MRILVTGGAGYVGSVSVERLLAAGHTLWVLDDLSTGHAPAVPPEATLSRSSYTDEDQLTRLLVDNSIEAILHCAARSLVGESIREPSIYYRANVVGGVALLEAARRAGVDRVVFSSTAAVYGVPAVTPITETTPLDPINPYGESKRTFEGALRWYGSAYGLRSIALRYFNVAGASQLNGEDHDPETHLIPNILAATLSGRPMTLFGDDYPTPDGTPIRDYIHVEDLARAHMLALEATDPANALTGPATGPCEPLVCNLGSGTGFSNRQVVSAAEAVIGRPISVKVGPRRPGDPPILVASPQNAHEKLGWNASQGTLEQIIGSAWEWLRAHPAGYAE